MRKILFILVFCSRYRVLAQTPTGFPTPTQAGRGERRNSNVTTVSQVRILCICFPFFCIFLCAYNLIYNNSFLSGSGEGKGGAGDHMEHQQGSADMNSTTFSRSSFSAEILAEKRYF